MKTLILFLAIWGITFTVGAQDYFPLNRLHSSSFYFAGNHQAYGISIRNSAQVGNDSVFLMNNVVGDARDSCPYFEIAICKSNAHNSFIDTMYKSSNGEYSFRLRNYYLYINYSPYWNLFEKHKIGNTGYIGTIDPNYISLENVTIENVLGSTDTVLTYAFYKGAKKLSKILKVSKEHGILLIPYFFNPMGSELYAINHSIPKYNEIYNYQIGDKYEMRGGGFGEGHLITYECIDRSINSLNDSASFRFYCKKNTYTQFSSTKIDSFYNTIYVANYSKPLFQNLPGQLNYIEKDFYKTYSISRSDLDTTLLEYIVPSYGVTGPLPNYRCKLIADSNDSTRFLSTVDGTVPSFQYSVSTYTIGLGVNYYEYYIGSSRYYSQLTYYKSANKTWGIMGIPENNNTIKKLQIIPNPASLFISFEGVPNNEPCKLIIHDAVGKIIYNSNISSGLLSYNQIDISSFAAGIYITELLGKNNEHIAVGKFVKE